MLHQAFVDGESSYYVGDSPETATLLEDMGSERLGVALLPSGPNGGAASPLLQLDALSFSRVSSDAEFDRALDFVQFLGGEKINWR